MEGEPTTYSGQEDVAAFFDKFEFKKSQVQIITLDSQPLQPPGSPQKDGVLVTVTGNHQVTGMPTKKFVQTFFLATEERRYYIFNDILRAEFAETGRRTRPQFLAPRFQTALVRVQIQATRASVGRRREHRFQHESRGHASFGPANQVAPEIRSFHLAATHPIVDDNC